MELQDYDGFGDSEVYDGGLSGPVNSLMPRFELEETESEAETQRTARSTSKKERSQKRQLSQSGRSSRLSPSNANVQNTATMLKVPASVVQKK